MRPAPRARLLAAGLSLIVAACGGPGTATPLAPTTSPASVNVAGGGRTPAPAAGIFDTAWGAARDALPPGFPVPAGATPANPGDPADGPVSGAFVVDGAPADVAASMRAGLAAAGYSAEGLNGPLEDGSLVIDSVGRDPACRIQVRVRPLGASTMVTVLYGASCPGG